MKPIVLRCFLKVKEEYFILKLQFWQFYYDRLSISKSFYLVASLSKLSQTFSSILKSTNCTCHRWYPGISIHFKVSMVTRPNRKDNFSHESDISKKISNDMILWWRHSKKRANTVSFRDEASTLWAILPFPWYETAEETKLQRFVNGTHTSEDYTIYIYIYIYQLIRKSRSIWQLLYIKKNK